MFDLYKNIVTLALEHGFKNVTELCRTAGVPRSNLTEIKMGRSKDISKPNAQKLADAMGVSLDAIYGNETKKEPVADVNNKLPKEFYSLSESEQKQVKDYISFLLSQRSSD